MKKYLKDRNPGVDQDRLPGQVVRYVTSIFHASYSPDQVGVAKCRELRTLAESIDHLCEGRLDQLGDTLMQRFSAVELSITEGSWSQAKHLELIPYHMCGLANRSLRASAVKEETRDLRLKELVGNRGRRKDR